MGLAGLFMGVQGLKSSAQTLGEGLAGTSAPPQRHDPRIAGLPDTLRRSRKIPAKGSRPSVGAAVAAGSIRGQEQSIATLDERVKAIRGRITLGMKDPEIYALARKITSATNSDGSWVVKEKDNLAEARLIFGWVRRNVRYTSDTYQVDTFATPRVTLKVKSGDCDDFTTVLACLYLSIGIPVQLVVVATKNGARVVDGVMLPNPDHIYIEIGLPRGAPEKWIPVDGSVNMPFGWGVPDAAIVKKWKYKPTL